VRAPYGYGWEAETAAQTGGQLPSELKRPGEGSQQPQVEGGRAAAVARDLQRRRVECCDATRASELQGVCDVSDSAVCVS
jgi:hypothetical protein